MKRRQSSQDAVRKRSRTASHEFQKDSSIHSGRSSANAIPIESDDEKPTFTSTDRRSVSSEVSTSGRASTFPYTRYINDSFTAVATPLQEYARTIPHPSAQQSLLIEGLPFRATFLDITRVLMENSVIDNVSQLTRTTMSSCSPGAAIISISRALDFVECTRRLSASLIEWKDGRTYQLQVQLVAALRGRLVGEDGPEVVMVISDDEELEFQYAVSERNATTLEAVNEVTEATQDSLAALSIQDEPSDMDLETAPSDAEGPSLANPPSPTPMSSHGGSTTSGDVSSGLLSRSVSTSSSANHTSPEPIMAPSIAHISSKDSRLYSSSLSESTESEDEIDELDEDDEPYVPYLAPAFPRDPSTQAPVRALQPSPRSRTVQRPKVVHDDDSSDSSSDSDSSASSDTGPGPGPSAFGNGPRSLSPTASEFVRLGPSRSDDDILDLTRDSSDDDERTQTPFPNRVRRRRIIRSPSRTAPRSDDDDLPAEYSGRLMKLPRHRPRRILVPFDNDKPLAIVEMKSSIHFLPRKEEFRLVGSLPEYETNRIVEDAVALRSGLSVVAYSKPDHLQIGLVSWDARKNTHALTTLSHAPHKPGKSGGLSCLSAGPSAHQFITGGTDCQLRLWTIDSTRIAATKSKVLSAGLPARPTALMYEANHVYAACRTQLVVMDVKHVQATPSKIPITTVHNIHSSRDPRQIVFEVGDLYDQAHVFDSRILTRPVLRLGYVSPEGKKQTKYFRGSTFDDHYFARGFQDGTVCIWDLRNAHNDPMCMKKFNEPAVHCATDETRMYVAAGRTMYSIRKSSLIGE